ncbi:uncharacterized protein MYCGRDRAFT_98001 [Zymoseptoria tritici IPO323]|uniref:Uncharacterized protein n=1 Tax=Zymoseptoria tritici (strain CBS 115943 / IPO323) TaxID=336722 RepID=F9XS11_ZYMTI|nr:uncharacterized protein MYCGRDRAFT_98001 [Zymoseptoria tritici IPO323]EGP81961.1 hypothetical protein MYCGRDRAFT_98001 [Zymoseptoria tritici IPO323]
MTESVEVGILIEWDRVVLRLRSGVVSWRIENAGFWTEAGDMAYSKARHRPEWEDGVLLVDALNGVVGPRSSGFVSASGMKISSQLDAHPSLSQQILLPSASSGPALETSEESCDDTGLPPCLTSAIASARSRNHPASAGFQITESGLIIFLDACEEKCARHVKEAWPGGQMQGPCSHILESAHGQSQPCVVDKNGNRKRQASKKRLAPRDVAAARTRVLEQFEIHPPSAPLSTANVRRKRKRLASDNEEREEV